MRDRFGGYSLVVLLMSPLLTSACRQAVAPRGSASKPKAQMVATLPGVKAKDRGPTLLVAIAAVQERAPGLSDISELQPLKYVLADCTLLREKFGTLGIPDQNLFILMDAQADKRGILATF